MSDVTDDRSEAELGAASEALYEVAHRLEDGAATIGGFASSPEQAVRLASQLVLNMANDRDRLRGEARRSARSAREALDGAGEGQQ